MLQLFKICKIKMRDPVKSGAWSPNLKHCDGFMGISCCLSFILQLNIFIVRNNIGLLTIYTRAHKLAHISYGLLHKHPWWWEVCAWQVWTKMFQRWGSFLKNMYLTLCQFLKKKSHPIRPVEGLKLCLDFLCNTDIT